MKEQYDEIWKAIKEIEKQELDSFWFLLFFGRHLILKKAIGIIHSMYERGVDDGTDDRHRNTGIRKYKEKQLFLYR